eukprot:sb/3467973/
MLLLLVVLLLPLYCQTSSKIRRVFDDIDSNDDRVLTDSELGAWFIYHDIEFARKTAMELFSMFDKDKPASPDAPTVDRIVESSIRNSVRRWKAAGGDVIEFKEFVAFAHPDLYQHMRGVLVQETIETNERQANVPRFSGNVSNCEYYLTVTTTGPLKHLSNTDPLDYLQLWLMQLWLIESMSHRCIQLWLIDSMSHSCMSHSCRDGVLSTRELGYWLMENRRLNTRLQSDEVFSKLDSDHNTRVSYTEWQRNIDHKMREVGGIYKYKLLSPLSLLHK